MAYGYGAPTANAAHLATGAIVGAGIGATQAIALNAADAAGALGAPVIPAIGTNGQLIDYVAGGAALGLGLAGAFGKGPLKSKTSISAAVATYGATAIAGGIAFRMVGGSVGSTPAGVAAVCRAKAALATRLGAAAGANRAMPRAAAGGTAAPIFPPNPNQRFSAAIS